MADLAVQKVLLMNVFWAASMTERLPRTAVIA